MAFMVELLKIIIQLLITNINITLKDSIVPSSQTPPIKSTEISDKAPSIETPPDTPVSNQL